MCCCDSVFDSEGMAHSKKCEDARQKAFCHDEVYGKCSENVGPMIKANDCQDIWGRGQSSHITDLVLVGIEYIPEQVITSGYGPLLKIHT